ncbi:MAG: trypsin-like peptidase domain-containing protein [Planctomycetota bacterium]
MAERRPGTHSSPFGLPTFGAASALLGLLVAAFGLGRSTAPLPPGPQDGPVDPRAAAAQVSLALQAASADAALSVVQVESYANRRGRTRKVLDGSGVVVDEEGLIVTNFHVVDGASSFRVVFTDGTRLSARLLGSDEDTDLAVLRVQSDEALRAMPLRLDLPPVGELVLAVGNPLSLGHTVTLGVVNGHGRSDLDIAQYENFIQTDAAINPGNSGGPLVDVQGRAVGITVAVGLASNGDAGLAFAIPAAMVEKVVAEITAHGRVRRAYLGVRTFYRWEAERALREDRKAGFDGSSRVKVREVLEGTPASRAGVRDGDVILSIGTREMKDSQSFTNALIEASPGEAVPVRVWRSGRVLSLSAALVER